MHVFGAASPTPAEENISTWVLRSNQTYTEQTGQRVVLQGMAFGSTDAFNTIRKARPFAWTRTLVQVGSHALVLATNQRAILAKTSLQYHVIAE